MRVTQLCDDISILITSQLACVFWIIVAAQHVISEIENLCLLDLAAANCCAWFYCAGGTGAEQAAAGLVLAEGLAAVTAVQSAGLRSVNTARRVKAFIWETNVYREILLRYHSCV